MEASKELIHADTEPNCFRASVSTSGNQHKLSRIPKLCGRVVPHIQCIFVNEIKRSDQSTLINIFVSFCSFTKHDTGVFTWQ